MDVMDSGNECEDEPISTEMLEDIRGSIKSRPSVNRREAHYKIHDRIKQTQTECKGALLSTQNMRKFVQKVFKSVVNDILQDLPTLGESGSVVSYLIPEPNFFLKWPYFQMT